MDNDMVSIALFSFFFCRILWFLRHINTNSVKKTLSYKKSPTKNLRFRNKIVILHPKRINNIKQPKK